MQQRKHIFVGLSGGVDSAVAAWRLQQAGVRLTAVFMKNWDDADEAAGCHDKDDLISAAVVADTLGVEFTVANFVSDYKQAVFQTVVSELQAGRTPNPDVLCNAKIKFASFQNYALEQGADAVATGHYAKIISPASTEGADGEYQLHKGEDANKDQSYFLHQLTQAQLARAVFPLADLHKNEVRAMAKQAGLPNWARKDSMGICFIGKRPFRQFIAPYVDAVRGEILDITSGAVVGCHDGLPFYTIGQRRGLGIGGRRGHAGGAWQVVRKEVASNRLWVVAQADAHRYAQEAVWIAQPHWLSHTPPRTHWVYSVRLRHRQPPAGCVLTQVDATRARIAFAQPQAFVAPGQYAVLYDGNRCLGGGAITDSPT